MLFLESHCIENTEKNVNILVTYFDFHLFYYEIKENPILDFLCL